MVTINKLEPVEPGDELFDQDTPRIIKVVGVISHTDEQSGTQFGRTVDGEYKLSNPPEWATTDVVAEIINEPNRDNPRDRIGRWGDKDARYWLKPK